MSGQEPRCNLSVALSDGEVECPDAGGFRLGSLYLLCVLFNLSIVAGFSL